MSRTLTDNAIAEFDAEVKHAYQGMGMLRGTVRFRGGVIGSTHRFPKMGKGTATRRVPQTRVVPMNIAHTKATATIEDWNAPEFTDIFDQQKVNYDERTELATVIAGAVGRREDQLILDALDAASTTLTVSINIGGTASGMNTAKFRKAKQLMDKNGVPKMGRTLVTSAQGLSDMLGDDDANTMDKNAVKALVDGELAHWLGFDIVSMDDRDEGGLPLSSSVRTSYAYHIAAAGLAQGIEFRTEVNYIPDMTSWLANGLFAAGSVAIDALGIVELASAES